MAPSEKDARLKLRLKLRLTPARKELLRQAAAIRGESLTEFVLAAVMRAAVELVDGHGEILLSRGAWEEFVRLTSEPMMVAPLLRREAADFVRRFEASECAGQ